LTVNSRTSLPHSSQRKTHLLNQANWAPASGAQRITRTVCPGIARVVCPGNHFDSELANVAASRLATKNAAVEPGQLGPGQWSAAHHPDGVSGHHPDGVSGHRPGGVSG
jgi:hypothetical protein